MAGEVNRISDGVGKGEERREEKKNKRTNIITEKSALQKLINFFLVQARVCFGKN
jgi:hypothetical protein